MAQPLVVPRLRAVNDLLLRPWELGDLPLVEEAARDEYIPLVTTIPADYARDAGAAFVRRQWEQASTGVGYPFVIVDVRGDRPIGAIGVWLEDVHQGRASLGYWVVKSARGRGAAASALRAVTVWALGERGIPRLHLYIEPWNVASARTAERAGFQREGLLRGWQVVGEARCDMVMYSMLVTDIS
jgi:ribosomal-protein-alanine N-acetyltransferase